MTSNFTLQLQGHSWALKKHWEMTKHEPKHHNNLQMNFNGKQLIHAGASQNFHKRYEFFLGFHRR